MLIVAVLTPHWAISDFEQLPLNWYAYNMMVSSEIGEKADSTT